MVNEDPNTETEPSDVSETPGASDAPAAAEASSETDAIGDVASWRRANFGLLLLTLGAIALSISVITIMVIAFSWQSAADEVTASEAGNLGDQIVLFLLAMLAAAIPMALMPFGVGGGMLGMLIVGVTAPDRLARVFALLGVVGATPIILVMTDVWDATLPSPFGDLATFGAYGFPLLLLARIAQLFGRRRLAWVTWLAPVVCILYGFAMGALLDADLDRSRDDTRAIATADGAEPGTEPGAEPGVTRERVAASDADAEAEAEQDKVLSLAGGLSAILSIFTLPLVWITCAALAVRKAIRRRIAEATPA